MAKYVGLAIVAFALGVLVLKASGDPMTRPIVADAAGSYLLLLALVLVTLGLAGAGLGGREGK